MNTIGEMKDVYVLARYVGISGSRIENFLKAAEIAGYILVRKDERTDTASTRDK